MTFKQLNQKGFAALEALLIVVILAILGGTGYYIYNANSKATDTQNAAQTNVNTAAPRAIKSKLNDSNSTLVSSDDKSVSFRIPKDWVVLSRVTGPDQCGFVEQPDNETCLNDISYGPKPESNDASYTKIFQTTLSGKDFFSKNVGDDCLSPDGQKEKTVKQAGMTIKQFHGYFNGRNCSGYEFYVVSNGKSVAYLFSGEIKVKTEMADIAGSVGFAK